ncbi:MAG: LPS export ABC transporter permease LptF, partial [Planctomycetota bacterium]
LLFALLVYFVYNNLLSLAQTWVAQDRLDVWVGSLAPHVLMLGVALGLFYLRSVQAGLRSRRA